MTYKIKNGRESGPSKFSGLLVCTAREFSSFLFEVRSHQYSFPSLCKSKHGATQYFSSFLTASEAQLCVKRDKHKLRLPLLLGTVFFKISGGFNYTTE